MKKIAIIALILSLSIITASCKQATVDIKTTSDHTPVPPGAQTAQNLPSPVLTETRQNDTPRVTDQEIQALYSSLLKDEQGKIIIIREDTFSNDTYPQDDEATIKDIQSNLSGVEIETIKNYLSENTASGKFASNMNLPAEYILISTADFLDITGNSNWQEVWQQRYPNSEVGCMAFSKIGFNESHTQALVYVTHLWEKGGYYLLKLNPQIGVWEIVNSYTNVIIN